MVVRKVGQAVSVVTDWGIILVWVGIFAIVAVATYGWWITGSVILTVIGLITLLGMLVLTQMIINEWLEIVVGR